MFTRVPTRNLIRGHLRRAYIGDRPGSVAATGPPWPSRIAPGGAHPPRRIVRWAIVVGIVFLAGSIAATVGLHAASGPSPRPASGYLLAASDAHFTAMFPGKPLRIEKTAGTTSALSAKLW